MTHLYISEALSPYGNPFGFVSVVADSREEAIEKARKKLTEADSGYVPAQRYRDNLLEHLDSMEVVDDDVFIDWLPSESRRRR